MQTTKHNDYWAEVEDYLSEKTSSGYKMAVIEADKILRYILKQKGYPGKDLRQQIFLAGWKLKEKKDLEAAIKMKDEILNNLDYRLSTFDTEDAVQAYKEAILHFTEKKPLGLRKKISLYYSHYLSLKSSFFRKTLYLIFGFFLLIKFFNSTEIGKGIMATINSISDFIFSWFMVFLLLGSGVLIIVLGSFLYFGKEQTKIKE